MMRRVVFMGLCLLAFAARAERLAGVVTHVTDGDTLWVRVAAEREAVQVRIAGIDAPEICQAFGVEARDALARHVLHQHVSVTTRARDRWHRSVGRVKLGHEDVGAWLVSHGYAWSDRYRGHAAYRSQEGWARSQRLGLWHTESPEAPRDFRKRHGSCH